MSAIWSDTLSLMMLGMGTVFVFLLLLVICLNVMSTVIRKILPEEQKDLFVEQELAAVAAAYHKYKKQL